MHFNLNLNLYSQNEGRVYLKIRADREKFGTILDLANPYLQTSVVHTLSIRKMLNFVGLYHFNTRLVWIYQHLWRRNQNVHAPNFPHSPFSFTQISLQIPHSFLSRPCRYKHQLSPRRAKTTIRFKLTNKPTFNLGIRADKGRARAVRAAEVWRHGGSTASRTPTATQATPRCRSRHNIANNQNNMQLWPIITLKRRDNYFNKFGVFSYHFDVFSLKPRVFCVDIQAAAFMCYKIDCKSCLFSAILF